ncbi:hypothetical protein CC86DRAFT_401597 [Ophiobolus disseminans]|uniref:Uncharacterized protein n=1 Tax=Ophiobolus disseminans TaxID=1469910 RepID=A0A6A7AE86_9PLEO|nr:hypothetical protein CC86DRAFT_401597 [Ophiobolus disseminans]
MGLSIKEADAIAVRNQTQSPLLKLPAEIRSTIFGHAFGHLMFAFPRYRCWSSMDTRRSSGRLTATSLDVFTLIKSTTVCHQIYAETALLPFKNNLFWLNVSAYKLQIRPQDTLSALMPHQQDAIMHVGLSINLESYTHAIPNLIKSGIFELGNLRLVNVAILSVPDYHRYKIEPLKERIKTFFRERSTSKPEVVFEAKEI